MIEKKLPLLAIVALGFLSERAMHPYEMYQLALHRREDRLLSISPGSLYRSIYAMEKRDLVRATGTERDGARPERTTFAITSAGRTQLAHSIAEMLSVPATEFPQFPVALSEISELDVPIVVDVLRHRLETLRNSADTIDAKIAWLRSSDVPEMYWLDIPYSLSLTRAEIAWIEALIARLESGELPWSDTRSAVERATALPPQLSTTKETL